MLSDRLKKTKTITIDEEVITIKKLPVRFREWAALRMYDLKEGKPVARGDFDAVLDVSIQTLMHGVASWSLGDLDEATCREAVLYAGDFVERVIREIEAFNVLDAEEKKRDQTDT